MWFLRSSADSAGQGAATANKAIVQWIMKMWKLAKSGSRKFLHHPLIIMAPQLQDTLIMELPNISV